jgi:hypothetical protein
MAECYQRASERACVTFPLFGQGFDFHFSNICHVTTRKLRLPQCIMGDDLHTNKQIFLLPITKRGNVANLELERQIRCNPYILPSDVEWLQQLYKSRWGMYDLLCLVFNTTGLCMTSCVLSLILLGYVWLIVSCFEYYWGMYDLLCLVLNTTRVCMTYKTQ